MLNSSLLYTSDTRIGDSPLTFGVWAREDLGDVGVREELLSRCEALWREKILSRLAIPEVRLRGGL